MNPSICEKCGETLKPAPARFDGEATFVGYLPHTCKPAEQQERRRFKKAEDVFQYLRINNLLHAAFDAVDKRKFCEILDEYALSASPPTPESKPLEVVEAAVDEAIRKYPKRTDMKPDVLKEERKAFVEGAEFVINRIAGTQWSSGGVDAFKNEFAESLIEGASEIGSEMNQDGMWSDVEDIVVSHYEKQNSVKECRQELKSKFTITRKEKGEQR